MKHTPFPALLSLTLCLAPVWAFEPDNEAAEIRKEAEEALKTQVEERILKAGAYIKKGETALAESLLVEALALDPENIRALELRKYCNELNEKVETLEDRQRDRRNFLPDPMDAVRANEKIGGSLARAQRRQLTSSAQRNMTPEIRDALAKSVSLKGVESGPTAVDVLRKSTGLNIVVDSALRASDRFLASPELELENVKAASCLNHLARAWGAQWEIQDEAIVFSLGGLEGPDIVPDGYKPPDFDKLDFGGLGLGGEPDAGLQSDGTLVVPVPRLKVRTPNKSPKVLVGADGSLQLLVDPEEEEETSNAKKKP